MNRWIAGSGFFFLGLAALLWVGVQWRAQERRFLQEQHRQERQVEAEATIRQVRSACHTQAIQRAISTFQQHKATILGAPPDEKSYIPHDYEMYYRECLRSAGLEN